MSARAAYALDDSAAEDVELFYAEAGGSTVEGPPPQPDFVRMTTPPRARPSAYTASSADAQFELEEPKLRVAGASPSFWDRIAPSNYDAFFQLNVSDLTTRLARALVPTRRLFEPPPAPSVPEQADDDEEGDAPQSIASAEPFNKSVDLYGPVWLTTTLVLCIAVGANILIFFRSLAAKMDPTTVSALTALNFRHLVQASSIVYTYTVAASAATVAGKRYYGDESVRDIALVLCVYGYSVAPFIPAVLLCAIPNTWLHWLFMLVAAGISSYFLCINLWMAGTTDSVGNYGSGDVITAKSPRWWMRGGCVAANVLIGVLLKLRFF